jgi:hypothetical protein
MGQAKVEEKVDDKVEEKPDGEVGEPISSSPEDGAAGAREESKGQSKDRPTGTEPSESNLPNQHHHPNHLAAAEEREEKRDKFNKKHDKFVRKFQSLESDLKRLLETMFLHPDVTGQARERGGGNEDGGDDNLEGTNEEGTRSGDNSGKISGNGGKEDRNSGGKRSGSSKNEPAEGMFLDHLIPYLGEVRQLRRTFAKLESRYLKFIVAEKVE